MAKYKYGRDARWTGEADAYTSSFSGTLEQRKAHEKAWAEFFSKYRKQKKSSRKKQSSMKGKG